MQMGVYPWNNMGNLLQRVRDRSMDAIVHMGDHACAHRTHTLDGFSPSPA